MKTLSLLVAIMIAACSGGADEQLELQIAVPAHFTVNGDPTSIYMQAGDKLVVALVAIGAKQKAVVFSGDALPPFATLDGQLLTLSPTRSQAGDYSLKLSATAGSEKITTTLRLSVGRYNSPPEWNGFLDMGDEQNGARIYTCPSSLICTIGRNPWIHMYACDPEGDRI